MTMDTKDTIEVKINLTNKDRERAMDYNYFVKRKLVLIDIIFFVVLALVLIAVKYLGVFDTPKALLYCSYGIIAMIAVFLILVHMLSSVGGGGPSRSITFTPEALITHVGSEKKEYTIRWEDLAHKGKTKNYYFLYPDQSQFFIIPKRYFSAEEIKTIDSYLR